MWLRIKLLKLLPVFFLSSLPLSGNHKTQSGGEEMHFSEVILKDLPSREGTGTLEPQKWENPRPDEVLAGIIKVNS